MLCRSANIPRSLLRTKAPLGRMALLRLTRGPAKTAYPYYRTDSLHATKFGKKRYSGGSFCVALLTKGVSSQEKSRPLRAACPVGRDLSWSGDATRVWKSDLYQFLCRRTAIGYGLDEVSAKTRSNSTVPLRVMPLSSSVVVRCRGSFLILVVGTRVFQVGVVRIGDDFAGERVVDPAFSAAGGQRG